MSITELPKAKSQPTRDLRDKATLLYGQPKIGKSTFCAGADGALFLATEPGLSHLEVFQIPVASWPDFGAAYQLIKAGDHKFKTVIIDTIDNLYKFCREYVLKQNNLTHEQDAEWGKGYDLVNNAFQRGLVLLSLLPYGLIMVSHAQEKEIKTRTGKATKIAPTLPNSARKIVVGMADYILYADAEDVIADDGQSISSFRRVIHSQPTTIYEAGARLEQGQTLPDPLPLDWNEFTAALIGGDQSNAKKQAA